MSGPRADPSTVTIHAMLGLGLAAVLAPVPARPLPPRPAALAPFVARVVAVHDGDTITVLRAKTSTRVRLHGIDCPESNQPYGAAAKKRPLISHSSATCGLSRSALTAMAASWPASG